MSEKEGTLRGYLRNLGCLALALIPVAIFLYPVFAHSTSGHRSSCLSYVKQTGTACQIYAADVDDRFPLAYTFDFPSDWDKLSDDQKRERHPAKRFSDEIMPYLKNDQMLQCPIDAYESKIHDLQPGREGFPGVMTYVHSLSLRGFIPDYAKGKRVIDLTQIDKPETVAYIRDPLRGYGKGKDGNMTFLSPHLEPNQSSFSVGYLDSHAKSTTTLDPTNQL